MQGDFSNAVQGKQRYLQIEQRIESARSAFRLSARELGGLVESQLQQPAWQELTQAAGRARSAAQNTETHLSRVTISILLVVLLIGGIVTYGIAAPVRRLLEGTRRLAGGRLDARVAAGGVRELNELAVAFNDMAAALDSSQRSLREQQAALEDRVAERTEDLRYLANHDPLTDLPNRRELVARLDALIERARAGTASCAVLYMDVDNFKTINDSLGHQFGDRVLCEIGARLLQVAGSDGFLARLGGDEFTLVVENLATAAAAEACVEQIMRAFSRPLRLDERELLVSLSIGIAMYPAHGDTTEALLRAADSALYDAKDRGRNGFSLYRSELLAAASHRFHTEQGLRRALETGGFLLHFQPEVSLVDKRTTAIEALLRWRQPDGRVAAAGEFIDIAERSGLILELSDWVLRHAVDAARELRRTVWPQARVAVNVSAQQFLTGRFVEAVECTLREAQMPGDCLEIELTETALQTGRVAVDALHALRRIGVTVALDDFGAGYSSLKSIGELPLTRVKLDRSLMQDVESKPSAAAIAQSFVRLCQSLRLTVTAEGIERPGQLDFLADCGDVQAQGFLLAKPQPIHEIARFIAETPLRLAAVWPQAAAWRRDQAAATELSPLTLLRSGSR
jgi:diguanylate cyclase (GGDEF)-like protein